MIEYGHMQAYRVAAERAIAATTEGDTDSALNAEKLMAAIRELEQARKEIFSRNGVRDIDFQPVENPDLSSLKEMSYEELPLHYLILRLRHEAGLTQDELSKKIGIGQSAISMIEHGELVPRNKNLAKVIEALGIATNAELVGLLTSKVKAARPARI